MGHAMDVFYCKRCATLRSGVAGQRVSFHEERAGSWRSTEILKRRKASSLRA